MNELVKKENKGSKIAAPNSTIQKKNFTKSGHSIVDNRPEAQQQQNLVKVIQRMRRSYGTFQIEDADAIDRGRLAPLFDIDERHDPAIHGAVQEGNQVTPAAFENILEMYSAIRRGDTAFRFQEQDTPLGTRAHKVMALGDIGKILQTVTGRELIQSLMNSVIPIDITKADTPGDAFEKPYEEVAGYQNAEEARIEVNYAPGQDYLNRRGERRIIPRGRDVKGTSDTILYHELVHAQHVASNNYTPGRLADTDNVASPYDVGVNKEEYATVGLGDYAGANFSENKYRAEQRRLQGDDDSRAKYDPRTSYLRFRM